LLEGKRGSGRLILSLAKIFQDAETMHAHASQMRIGKVSQMLAITEVAFPLKYSLLEEKRGSGRLRIVI